jgi:hypothetical protein
MPSDQLKELQKALRKATQVVGAKAGAPHDRVDKRVPGADAEIPAAAQRPKVSGGLGSKRTPS